MPDPIVITTMPETETPEVVEAPKKKTFPTKSFVRYAAAATVAAVLGGYVVKKATSKDCDDDEDEGWTIEAVTPETESTN